MLLQIDLQSDTPIYTQLVRQIIDGIARKQLLPGEALPSVRSLAGDLGINLHTVNKAYQLLKQEGYVQVHRQRGVMVNPEPPPPADEAYYSRLREQLQPLVAEARCRGVDPDRFVQECVQLYRLYE